MSTEIVKRLASRASRLFPDRTEVAASASPLPGLSLLCHRQPTTLRAGLYTPVVCLILQGRKETTLADRTVAFGPGESLVVSHDLPVVSRITKARPDAPYLALILSLDFDTLRSLHATIDEVKLEPTEARSLEVHMSDPQLLDGFRRYLELADSPLEAKVLAPLLRQEIHFRLLMAPHGGMLRRLLRHDSHANSVARAIKHIRTKLTSRILIPELAQAVGMSPSAFHKHFKAVTATTPLQYQKDLRLLEARRLLTVEGRSVSDAAFDVGYESPTQFSREYSRKFGAPPSADTGQLAAAGGM